MSALWTSGELAKAIGGTASADFAVQGVAFDSREVGVGDLFIALKGEATDGHRFVEGAFGQGAAGAIVSEPVSGSHILVADTTAALDALGFAARGRTAARIAGVTGSVGKTGTKEVLAAALARANRGGVHRSVKSYNNHTGVPLSLARMPADSTFAVFEMGMNHAGEIRALTKMVRPHVAVITAIASAHIEHLGSLEAIADAKAEVFEGLTPGGTAIIPFDTQFRGRITDAAKAAGVENILTFGRGEGADVRPVDVIETANGTMIMAKLPSAELSFKLAYPGEHWVSNAMAVLAVVQALGGDLAAAGLALGEMEGLAGRGARHSIAIPDGGTATLIDESYNANPASMAATLSVLATTPATRRIAVLGEMRELGGDGEALHASLAEPVIQAGVEFALLVGTGMTPLAKALEGKCEINHVAGAEAALVSLMEVLRDGDTILIKGSNAVGLSQIVSALVSGRR